MSNITENILNFAKKAQKPIKTSDIVKKFGFSRQHINGKISELVESGKLIKIGSTRNAQYITPKYAIKHPEVLNNRFIKKYQNKNLEEHKILEEIENNFSMILKLNENVRSIFTYAFSEMLNNAIEHSQSENIQVEVGVKNNILSFIVDDFGIGVFRNIMIKRKLNSELEAVQDLLKGKTTTMPRSHSGEGIFFTSKVGNEFILDSYGYKLIINNTKGDIFLQKNTKKGRRKKGTKVIFKISINSKKHLNDVFKEYSNIDDKNDYGFDKTKINIKLYTSGGVHISRSQARRVLSGLEKFRFIVFDFDKVEVVGQAFADEIFRVFHNKYPEIKLEAINMNDAVEFMVKRVEK